MNTAIANFDYNSNPDTKAIIDYLSSDDVIDFMLATTGLLAPAAPNDAPFYANVRSFIQSLLIDGKAMVLKDDCDPAAANFTFVCDMNNSGIIVNRSTGDVLLKACVKGSELTFSYDNVLLADCGSFATQNWKWVLLFFGALEAAADNQPVSVVPLADATGVSVTPSISATFLEPIENLTDATFFLTTSADLVTHVGVVADLGYEVSNFGKTVTFVPSVSLAAATAYTVHLAAGIQNESSVALSSEYTWEFTTA